MPMKPKKTITICCSASFFKESIKIGKKLKDLGFKVLLPKTILIMKRTKNYDISTYKTWYSNSKDYYKKTILIKDHFKKVVKGDAILVLNFEKNGTKGYIGGNTLMEMTVAFLNNKPIYIYNDISDYLNIKEEIYGLKPIFIKGNLKKIKN